MTGSASRWSLLCAIALAVFTAAPAQAVSKAAPPATGDTPSLVGDPGAYGGADPQVLAADASANAEDENLLTPPNLPSMPADANASSAGTPPQGAQAQAPVQPARDDDPRAVTDFEPRLNPYGAWVDDPKYGRIWIPDRSIVGEQFSPYVTGGHWALDTDNNWVWVSDYPFGDVVFHYGRWAWTSYGWSWVPGYTYAPAWVVWRVPTGPYDYVGWAPMPPAWGWFGGVSVGFWFGPPYYWVFCPSPYVFSPYPYHYVVTRPGYVHTLAHYSRHYATGAPHVAAHSPTLAAAHVPSSSLPASRIPAASGRINGPGRFASPSSFAASRTIDTSRPSSAASRTWSPAPSRTWSAPVRTYSPQSRTFSPAPRVYSPSARPAYAPSQTWAPARTAPAAAPRVYSPSAPTYSAPRVYSPPARTYSAPRVSAPTHVYSPSSWHSAPSFHSAPAFHGGGGGGGHHR